MNEFLISLLVSQAIFAKTYGGTINDEANSLTWTTDAGFAVAGTTWSFGVDSSDFLVLKLDDAGNLQWARTFGGTDCDEAFSITQTPDNGFTVAGGTRSYGSGDLDCLLLKLDSDGNPQWSRTFGGTNEEEAYSITRTRDGGFAISGYTKSFGAGLADFLCFKLDSAGNLQWAKTFGGQITNTPTP